MERRGTVIAAREGAGERPDLTGDERPTLAGFDFTFVPGDPPRSGCFAAFRLDADRGQEHVDEQLGALGDQVTIDLLLPAEKSVRRRQVRATLLPVATALPLLLEVEGSPATTATARLWASVMTAGLGLIARGRLHPAVSPGGVDAWRAGPLGPEDRRLLEQLAEVMPPLGHAVPLAGAKPPRRVHSPAFLIAAAWDALADTLPRTAAAVAVSGGALFAATEPTPATELRPWLAEASGGLDGGASFALRVQLGDAVEPEPKGVLQISSISDPSLVVDAADLFSMPVALLARFGERAERDLLLALRRGSRAWEPIGALLDQRIPDALALDDDLLADLLLDGANELGRAGISVLWPSELLRGGLGLRAVLTPTPAAVAEGGFDLGRLLDFHYELTVDGEALSPEEIDLLAEAKRGLVRIRGRFVAVDTALIAKAQERRSRRVAAAAALGALLAGKLEVDGELVDIVAEGALAEMAERLRRLSSGTLGPLAPPRALVAELRPYQLRGLAWLAGMSELGLGGCLADDMGLGKTVQVIALHLHRLQQRQAAPLERPALRAGGRRAKRLGPAAGTGPDQDREPAGQVAGTGPDQDREPLGQVAGTGPDQDREPPAPAPAPTLVICPTSLLGNWERELHKFAPSVPVRRFHGGERHLGDLADGEVVLTTYGVLRREREALAQAGFALVVADEAQHAKNPLSDTAKSLRAIPAQARIALTGTPVENRLTELWSVLDWTTPGLLGPLERFRRTVAVAVERNRDEEATERLASAVRPFLLRRKKTDPGIAPDLPERTVTDLAVPLSTEQVSLYEAEVREALHAIATKSGIERQGLVLRMLTVLKQICNHPAQYLHQAGPLPGRSGKLAALEELLDVIVGAGDCVLVFSQFVEMCSLIEAHLASLHIPTLFLHGGVPARKREEMVARFQSGTVPVFLLSLKAGGVGLNLTQATHVVHYDRWWNPAVEDQASDRAHRIGQRRAVQIHRLVCEGTLEDRVSELLEKKRALAESVVGHGEAWIGDLTDSQLADLVSLGPSGGET
ncbi:MAG: DEAD/DEAH box helicase [Acidimicrobiales bacterium]